MTIQKVPCRGSFAQSRQVNIEKLGENGRLVILRHPACDCNTGCRRVTLWHPRPLIEDLDDFVVKAIARVRWGDGCGGPEVEVDWKHGVILDLSGCYDEVELQIVEIGGTAPDEDNLFTFGALSACCGAGAARGVATRTLPTVTVAGGGGGASIRVPPFAYAVTFAANVPADFFVATTGILQLGSGIGGVITQATGDNLADPWLLAGGVETIAVTNDGAGELNFEPVFLIGV